MARLAGPAVDVHLAPVVVGTVILLVGIWWLVSARHTFKGPRTTVEDLEKEVGV